MSEPFNTGIKSNWPKEKPNLYTGKIRMKGFSFLKGKSVKEFIKELYLLKKPSKTLEYGRRIIKRN